MRDPRPVVNALPDAAPADTIGQALHPTDELVSRLHFDTREGRIWLNDQRMVLLHNSALGVFRQELFESLGAEKARGLITRMGYNCGAHDADLAHRFQASTTPTRPCSSAHNCTCSKAWRGWRRCTWIWMWRRAASWANSTGTARPRPRRTLPCTAWVPAWPAGSKWVTPVGL